MPSRSGTALHLSHTIHNTAPLGLVVPTNLPVVSKVFNSNHAESIPHTSPLASIKADTSRYVPPEVVAVRVPLLHLRNFEINDWPELSAKSFAVMVLMLPPDSARKWRTHELELVEVVADQVVISFVSIRSSTHVISNHHCGCLVTYVWHLILQDLESYRLLLYLCLFYFVQVFLNGSWINV
jgi:hypothetical protein